MQKRETAIHHYYPIYHHHQSFVSLQLQGMEIHHEYITSNLCKVFLIAMPQFYCSSSTGHFMFMISLSFCLCLCIYALSIHSMKNITILSAFRSLSTVHFFYRFYFVIRNANMQYFWVFRFHCFPFRHKTIFLMIFFFCLGQQTFWTNAKLNK